MRKNFMVQMIVEEIMYLKENYKSQVALIGKMG